MKTTTTSKGTHYYDFDSYTRTVPDECVKGNEYSKKCPHMAPCGHCRYLGYMCPYNGIRRPPWQIPDYPIVWC